jgi:hypothetical protein
MHTFCLAGEGPVCLHACVYGSCLYSQVAGCLHQRTSAAVRIAGQQAGQQVDGGRPHLRCRCLLLVYKEDLGNVLARDSQLDKLRAPM